MKRKIVSTITLVLLLSMIHIAFKIQKTRAAPTVFIRADGSVFPASAPISSLDNITYTFTANMNASLVVERSNTVIDGAGHTVQGDGSGNGFSLFNVTNVAIRKVNIHGFYFGIYFTLTSHSSILENNVTSNSYDGIQFLESSANVISQNYIAENSNDGVKILNASDNNLVSDNLMTRNTDDGIQFTNCSDNRVIGNEMKTNTDAGLTILRCTNITVSENDVTGNMNGISLSSSSDCLIKNNNVTSSGWYGLWLEAASRDTLSENNISDCHHGVYISSSLDNLVSRNVITESSGDGVWLDYGHDNNVTENTVSGSDDKGIYIRYSINNTVSGNRIHNNYYGISTTGSSSNRIYANNITDNANGVALLFNSVSNRLFHNNFVNNTQWASSTSINSWNELYEGNYWSNYIGVDLNNDGLGDSPYVLDANNRDNFPLMGMFHSFSVLGGTMVNVISNSSTIDFETFESLPNVTIRMHVSNMTSSQTYGFCRIRIPHAFMRAPFSATVDGAAPLYANYTLRDNASYRWIYLNYQHSTVEIVIQGLESIPPNIHILSPENKAYPADNIPLIFTVNEPTFWIGYSLDGQSNTTIGGNTTLNGLLNGEHSVRVFANDTFGNMGHSNTAHFTVDTVPPTILIVSPENRTYGSDQVSLNIRTSEPHSWIGYSLDGSANVTITGNTTIGGLIDAPHYINVYANDTLGNMGSSATVYFTVFAPAPSVYILSPENRTYTVVDIPLTFTVDEPVVDMSYSLDGQANVTITGNTTLTGLSEGPHRVVVYANDTDGNIGLSDTIHFTVDLTPPDIGTVSQLPIADNVLPTDTVRINATVTDNLSGVKSVVLNYTTDNTTWFAATMTKIDGNIWNGTIPPHSMGTKVTYVIKVEDNANHTITSEDLGYAYSYTVVPEFPFMLTVPLFMIATFLAAMYYKRKRRYCQLP